MSTQKSGTNAVSVNVPSVFSYGLHKLRTITIENDPWLVGKDVCYTLGLKSHRDSLSNLDEDERRESLIPTPSGSQRMVVINESGLYHLIFRSNKPEAKAFRKWVTSEVLPAIRKNGTYVAKDLNVIRERIDDLNAEREMHKGKITEITQELMKLYAEPRQCEYCGKECKHFYSYHSHLYNIHGIVQKSLKGGQS